MAQKYSFLYDHLTRPKSVSKHFLEVQTYLRLNEKSLKTRICVSLSWQNGSPARTVRELEKAQTQLRRQPPLPI
jgi:hypothetical protein